MKNKSGPKLSTNTITPQNDIGKWFTAFRLHGIDQLFKTTHLCYSIMVWVFGHHDYTFIHYLACCTLKITTRCKERKVLISSRRFEFHCTDHFYSSQPNRHELANHHRIIQLYVYCKYHFEPFYRICVPVKLWFDLIKSANCIIESIILVSDGRKW